MDPQVLSEVRQEMNEAMEGQAVMTSKFKEALNRIAASRPARRRGGREVMRSKVDSGACCSVICPETAQDYPTEETEAALKAQVRSEIGAIATPDVIHFTPSLPKTRSGKIMRRILRKIAEGEFDKLGDTSTLADPDVVDSLIETRREMG